MVPFQVIVCQIVGVGTTTLDSSSRVIVIRLPGTFLISASFVVGSICNVTSSTPPNTPNLWFLYTVPVYNPPDAETSATIGQVAFPSTLVFPIVFVAVS